MINKGTQYLIMLSSVHAQYYPDIRTTSPSAATAVRMCFLLIVVMNIILSYWLKGVRMKVSKFGPIV